ncbi:hypothetical protein P8C59_004781 [Phyllachora maydis]|uniref:Cns1/TTC4 wheel domain-containing protein n=1 Tax=Phyllachora maydis TaxID=1825666 RepID=A0AAD9I3C3_9PEZI|nr:hypothetical protein P8C59_004781 [Phyllachora maydis]
MAKARSQTTEELFAEFNKHPFFMTDLDESNEAVEALQALAYDGTPLENAANFKEQGNECFRDKKFADAREFYAKGIAVLVADEQASSSSSSSSSQQRALLEQLYVNRAACQLELANYRSCTADCAGALRLNPANVKALYRSGRALLALGKTLEADDACARALDVDPANAALQALAADLAARHDAARARAARDAQRAARDRRRRLLLRAALQARGIVVARSPAGAAADGAYPADARVQLLPDPDAATSALCFPTLLVYALDYRTDFIRAFDERDSLEQHFGYVFPLPWDRAGVYAAHVVDCFVLRRGGAGVRRVACDAALLAVLTAAPDVVVWDEVVRVFVVPKARSDYFVRHWREVLGVAG